MHICASVIVIHGMHSVQVSIENVFQSLSDSTRVRIIRLMSTVGSSLCSCELVDCLNEPEYKISRHLKILKAAGLITAFRDGKWVYHDLVKSEKYLRLIYNLIQEFPQSNEIYDRDVLQFKKRMKLRKSGRCTVGPLLHANPKQVEKSN